MKPLPKSARDLKPYCREIWTSNFDHLVSMMLRRQLPDFPDRGLKEWLGLMAGDRRAAVSDLGAKIAVAMKEVGLKNNYTFIFKSICLIEYVLLDFGDFGRPLLAYCWGHPGGRDLPSECPSIRPRRHAGHSTYQFSKPFA